MDNYSLYGEIACVIGIRQTLKKWKDTYQVIGMSMGYMNVERCASVKCSKSIETLKRPKTTIDDKGGVAINNAGACLTVIRVDAARSCADEEDL
jgi:hypothetical protein